MKEITLQDKFYFHHYLFFQILIFNTLAVSSLPLVVVSVKIVYVFQLLVFFVGMLLILDIDKKFVYRFQLNLKFILSSGIISFFLLSNFFYNIDVNLDFFVFLKIFSFPIVIIIFYIYFPKLFINNIKLFDKFLASYLYCSLLMVLFSLMKLFLGMETGGIASSGLVRGFFYYSNIFAFVFTFSVPIIFYLYFKQKITLSQFLVYLLPSLFGLLFTFSRAGYIGVLAGILVMVFKKSKKYFLITIAGLLLIGTTFVFDFAKAKGNLSAISRAQVMLTGYDMIVNHGIEKFLWGYGVAYSKEVFINELAMYFEHDREEIGPHNFILTMGIQFGLLVTFFCTAYVIYILMKSQILLKKNIYKLNDEVNLCIAIVISILVQCLFEDIVIYPEYFVMPLFLLFLGFLNRFQLGIKLPCPD